MREMKRIAALAFGLLATTCPLFAEQPKLETKAADLGIPFDRYTTTDSHGRTITFYLSRQPKANPAATLPVILFIQGSGCQSLFQKQGDKIGGGIHYLAMLEAKDRARILVVEKPGVRFLDQPARPGSAIGASDEYLKEHTLPRWAEANAAALRAVLAMPEIDASRSLVMGHSEGGITAARVAAEVPQVTHVATLAGGGPSQLFDFITLAAKPRPDDKPGDANERIQGVFDQWTEIQKHPDSVEKMWMGHPYRRWSSFMSDSPLAELLRSKARVYAAQGTGDTIIPVIAHDALVAELKSRGRDVTSDRVEGADHGFQTPDAPKQGPPAGFSALLRRVISWYLDGKPA